MISFKEFIKEEGDTGIIGTSSADIATVTPKINLSKPCKKHGIIDCKICTNSKNSPKINTIKGENNEF